MCIISRPSFPGGHGLSDLHTQRLAQRRRHGVPDLPVLVQDGAVEVVGVGETLAPGTLPHTQHPARSNLMPIEFLELVSMMIHIGIDPLTCSARGESLCPPCPAPWGLGR